MDQIEVVRVPEWSQFPWLRHGFSTRQGGRSSIYGGRSLNLGWTTEDDPNCVRENRADFVEVVSGGSSLRLVTVRQVHSNSVVRIDGAAARDKLETIEGKAVLEGDGLVTDIPGLLIAAGTADCVPVLVVDLRRRVVAAFHTGWRGTAARIVEQGIAVLRSDFGSAPEDIRAAIGPSIGSCCYNVGDEVRQSFVENFSYGQELFTERSDAGGGSLKLYADLWEANRRQLLAAGVVDGHITVLGECTACTFLPDGVRKYFSHRAEAGKAGRMLNVVGLV
jgi:YfiH family protein